jgi:membrane protein YqaA with SNARE-associated domain
MKLFLLRHMRVILLVGAFLIFSTTFYLLSPETILSAIGVENAYLFMFLLAFAGGVTTFSGIPYHLVMIAFASGGLSPWLLGLWTACGVMLGDTTSYFLGRQGSKLMSSRAQIVFDKLKQIEEQHPRFLPLAFLLYGTFIPFSNDLLVIPAGLLGYPFWRVMIPLGIGNLLFNIGLALVATYATEYLAVFM